MGMLFTRKTVGLAVGILALGGIASAAPESKPIPSMELARSLIDAEQFERRHRLHGVRSCGRQHRRRWLPHLGHHSSGREVRDSVRF